MPKPPLCSVFATGDGGRYVSFGDRVMRLRILKFAELRFFYCCLALAVTSCAVVPNDDGSGDLKMSPARMNEIAKETCEADPLVGKGSKVSATIDAKRKNLESLQASLSVESYSKLSQEIGNYTVEWEIVNGKYIRSCRSLEVCKLQAKLWKNEPASTYCEMEWADFKEQTKAADSLFKSVLEFNASKPET